MVDFSRRTRYLLKHVTCPVELEVERVLALFDFVSTDVGTKTI